MSLMLEALNLDEIKSNMIIPRIREFSRMLKYSKTLTYLLIDTPFTQIGERRLFSLFSMLAKDFNLEQLEFSSTYDITIATDSFVMPRSIYVLDVRLEAVDLFPANLLVIQLPPQLNIFSFYLPNSVNCNEERLRHICACIERKGFSKVMPLGMSVELRDEPDCFENLSTLGLL